MLKTIKSKIVVYFLVVLLVFISLSTVISYKISKQILLNSYVMTKENTMNVIVNDIKDIENNLSQDMQIFADDFNKQIRGFEWQEPEDIWRFRSDVNSYLKTILYSQDYIKGFYYIEKDFNIGVSFEEESKLEYVGMGNSLDEQYNFSKNDILDFLRKIGIEYRSGQIVFSKCGSDSYIVAVLNIDEIIKQSNKKLAIIDSEGYCIAETLDSDFDLSSIKKLTVNNKGEIHSGYIHNDSIISVFKDNEGSLYFLLSDIKDILKQLEIIRIRLTICAAVLFIMFLSIVLIESERLIKPIREFDEILNSINDVGFHNMLKRFVNQYKKRKSIYFHIHIIFSLAFIPILISLSISYFSFRSLAYRNLYEGYSDVTEQIVNNIENKVKSYRQYMRYIMLDKKLQQILIDTGSANNSSRIAEVILDKGILNNGINSITIYNSNKEAIYKSNKNKPSLLGKEKVLSLDNNEIMVESENGETNLVLCGEIKCLPSMIVGSNSLKTIGYLELDISGFLNRNLKFLDLNPLLSQYIYDTDFRVITKLGSIQYNMEDLKSIIKLKGSEKQKYLSGIVNTKGTFITYKPIKGTSWYLSLILPPQVFNKDNILTLMLIYGVLLNIQLGVIILLSRLIGDNILSNIKLFQKMMENIDDDYSVASSISIRPQEYEFIMLAKSFHLMLQNLKEMSDTLRKRELENIELNARRKQTLLVAYQSQIKPHFLNNIITSIILLLNSGEIGKATQMLISTGKFFRASLYGVENIISLKEELEHVHHYLKLQQIRYGDNLDIEVNIESKYELCRIPKFTLQPILENSIEHGMKENETLHIKLFTQEDSYGCFIINVEDNGKGISEEKIHQIYEDFEIINKEHYGLCCVNERLQLQFGKEYRIKIISTDGSRTKIQVKLPFKTDVEDSCLN